MVGILPHLIFVGPPLFALISSVVGFKDDNVAIFKEDLAFFYKKSFKVSKDWYFLEQVQSIS